MKKAFLLVFAICIGTICFAQEHGLKRYHLGFEIRPTYSVLSTNLKYHQGLSGDLKMNIAFPFRYVFYESTGFEFSLGTGINLKNLSSKIGFWGRDLVSSDDIFIEDEFNITSAQIPAMTYLKFENSYGSHTFFQTGFSFGYNLKCKGSEYIFLDPMDDEFIENIEFDPANRFRKFVAFYELGVGVEFKLNKQLRMYGLFQASFMMNNILKEIEDFQSEYKSIDEEGTFNTFSVALGFSI